MFNEMRDAYSNANSWDSLAGVDCDAVNCYYNKDGHICTADHIKVGTMNACSSMDTLCDTFKPR